MRMLVSKKASIDVEGANGLRRRAKDAVRPEAFFLLGQQHIDEFRLRRGPAPGIHGCTAWRLPLRVGCAGWPGWLS